MDGLDALIEQIVVSLRAHGYMWEYREGGVRHFSKDDFTRAKLIAHELWVGYADGDMECFVQVTPDRSIEKAESLVARMVNEVNNKE